MVHQETQLFEDEPALIRCLPQLNDLRLAGELTDLSIELQDHVTLHVHSVVLVSRVASLRDCICGKPRKKKPSVLQWPTVSSEAARPLIDYVYTGQLKVNEAHAADLVMLSKQLVLPRVEEWVLSFMATRVKSENLADSWNFARLMNSDQLMNACLQHMTKNFEFAIVSDFFSQLPLDTALSLLRSDDLRVESEESVFKAIQLWVSPGGEVDDTRVIHAAEMMREVRWNQIKPEFRYKLLEDEGFWNTDVKCLRLLGCISSWLECPSSRVGKQCPYSENYRGPLEKICLVGSSTLDDDAVLIRYDVETGTSEQLEILGSRDRPYTRFVSIEDCIFAIGTCAEDVMNLKVEKFDTKERRWDERAPLSTGQFSHAAVSVRVGREYVICVFGGHNKNYEDGFLNNCELYSPQENRWYALPRLKERRELPAAVSLPDGRVFVIGGVGSSGDALSSVEACHLREPADWQRQRKTSGNFWRRVAPMHNTREGGHSLVAFKGRIFVAGGVNTTWQYVNTVEVFVPPCNQQDMGQWTTLSNSTLNWNIVQLIVWQDRLFSFCSNYDGPNSILEFVPPQSASSPSQEKFDLWTWTDRGTVGALTDIMHAFILR